LNSRRKSVLIIDDDRDCREVLRDLFELSDISVIEAVDGESALDGLTRGTLPLPSLILLDVEMPGLDGWQFLEAMRRHRALSWLPVVVLSGYDPPSGARAKLDGYFVKPCDTNALMLRVRELLAQAPKTPLQRLVKAFLAWSSGGTGRRSA
jgi:CheY-like chemotaxis protein